MKLAVLIVLYACCVLGGCTWVRNSGLMYMDDYWCHRHPDAPAYRCPPPPPKEYQRP